MLLSGRKFDSLQDPSPGTRQCDSRGLIGADIVSTVLRDYQGEIAVRLWDNTLVQGKSGAPCTIVFREPGALRELILHRNLLRLVDAYLAGAIDVEGDIVSLFELEDSLKKLDLSLLTRLHLVRQVLRLPGLRRCIGSTRLRRAKLTAHRNSRSSIAHHYDVGNDFYALWLDPEMVYSCAYYRSNSQPLAEAQRDKLDYLCRKLRLKPGQTLLDIGCGWGALALWAARHYGVKVHGITLSEAQLELAQTRVHDSGLEGQVHIELLDYRKLPDDRQYDRVVSVGMFEHVGIKNLPTYFSTVRRVLKPDGLFLNHGITSETGWKRTPMTRFMNRYIFPDGELARISDVTDAMEQAGFEPLDVECLRRHYALTLRHWVDRLEGKRDEAIACSSEVTYRLWRLYMAGCAWYFDEGSISLHQVLAGHRHQPQPVPLRRDDLYN
ncbi:cyclopropane-fatty-acyl-phospholipid synthase [Thiogranum longum]|uniref:Cyclopropane-fatty-acyl-phospholipid synthase n=1 Tax=Thiogranum longum TaxID=1537524 RepID=A0A4R1H842_9GAMM|nr:cyclopropane-fatty-acyl-phospholipid synthase family protein [Thiogranum longum]TCK18004.1 cyclopropane-fatty-acyl-phospholipid synthase [Thiogranum longum]